MWRQLINLPECAYEARRQWEHGNVSWFGEGPVVRGEGPRQRTLAQGDDEVDTPEKSHGVVDLQIEDVPLEETFVVVFDEDAAGWWAVRVSWWGEVLRGGRMIESVKGDTFLYHSQIPSIGYCAKIWEFYLRVTILSAVDTLTPARIGVESHDSVDRISWSGQISARICLREEPPLWTVQAIVNCVTSDTKRSQSTVCMQTYTHIKQKDTKQWHPSKQHTPTGGQRWPEGTAERTSCDWLPCENKNTHIMRLCQIITRSS